MLNYVIRRILFMIPTVIGITFLIFLLLALSPGGIGAALTVSGGQQDASKAAILQAYLEDRYGLNDPVVVQYARWLHRLSPVKFGTRDRVTPGGERLQPPKAIPDPPLVDWIGGPFDGADVTARASTALAEGGRALPDGDDTARQRAYRKVANNALAARSRYLASRRTFESSLVDYATAAERQELLDRKGKIILDELEGESPDRANAAWPKAGRARARQCSACPPASRPSTPAPSAAPPASMATRPTPVRSPSALTPPSPVTAVPSPSVTPSTAMPTATAPSPSPLAAR